MPVMPHARRVGQLLARAMARRNSACSPPMRWSCSTMRPRGVAARSTLSVAATAVRPRCTLQQAVASAVVLISAFGSMAALAAEHYPRLPMRLLLRDRWNSAALAHRLQPPVLVVRAERDTLVLPAAIDRLLAALPTEPQVLNLSRRGHNTVQDDPTYWPAILDFLAP